MLFKKTIAVLAAVLLAVAPFGAFAQTVQEGEFPNGAVIQWICHPKANGQLQFRLITPEGQAYQGVLSCGEPI